MTIIKTTVTAPVASLHQVSQVLGSCTRLRVRLDIAKTRLQEAVSQHRTKIMYDAKVQYCIIILFSFIASHSKVGRATDSRFKSL